MEVGARASIWPGTVMNEMSDSSPHLRLTAQSAPRSHRRDAETGAPDVRPIRSPSEADSTQNVEPPALTANDPRWVLAIRTHELLDGSLLRPEARERLLRLGRTMGLGPFDANLVIAIVQDQARRGLGPGAGVGQLALIPTSNPVRPLISSRVVWLTSGCIAVEILAILAWL